jgi:hypothetical protein
MFVMFVIVAILYCLCVVAVALGRQIRDGIGYNFCLSVTVGTFGLIGVMIVAVRILRFLDAVPAWLHWYQIIWPIGCIIFGQVNWRRIKRKGNPQAGMDGYHNTVVVPICLCILGLSIPILWMYADAKDWFQAGASVALWGIMFFIDAKDGTLQQEPLFEKRLREAAQDRGWLK